MNAIIALCHFCEGHGPQVMFCTQPIHPKEQTELSNEDAAASLSNRVRSPSGDSSVSSKSEHTCEGCYSVKTGFVSHDNDAPISYISSKYPNPTQPEIYSLVRNACLRSLSGEVCPGNEGAIFFGNDQQGHVLSYTFQLKDNLARGFQRKYSIIVMMMDKIYLLNSWPFLVPHLKILIEHLQDKAGKVYESEQAKCPQRAVRLKSSINAGNFFQQRGGNNPARSLMELTKDKNIFKILHVAFVWILKACSNRITETLLEGPPTEDSIIDMEKQEETEEGFIKLFSKPANEVGDGDTTPLAEEREITDEDIHPSELDNIHNLRLLLKVLGESNFHLLTHHVVIGNQVIIRGSYQKTIKLILHALMMLVPRGCCRSIFHSNEYQESFRCNFLGLTADSSLPSHILSSEMFVLLVEMHLKDENDKPQNDNDFHKFEYSMASPTRLMDKAPTVLQKIQLALNNERFSNGVMEQCLICLKEEWMNKVKVLYKFTKAGGSISEIDTHNLLQVVDAKEEDKQLLKFWTSGLSVQYRDHIRKTSKSQH
ncbi:folliculin-like [Mytilus californianus]|uniref:folliculin-like n=1 Tax=Mytilus californianus TaxID=6549 RepID=UPI00224715E3|nr:folliculin-like [Mytilus californianus]